MKTVDMEATGIRIDRMRQERGMTVADVMATIGFTSPNTFSKWKKGKCMPTIDNLVALADIFGCSIGDIVAVKTV
ncbi:MAG: helix-turn-helix domain-containing protein [Lachnospiraceae bacterium]|nr:helix-turn-helix domain-containing protein [Lachnospiraceae bacterium]